MCFKCLAEGGAKWPWNLASGCWQVMIEFRAAFVAIVCLSAYMCSCF